MIHHDVQHFSCLRRGRHTGSKQWAASEGKFIRHLDSSRHSRLREGEGEGEGERGRELELRGQVWPH